MQATSGYNQTFYIILGTCIILSSALAACSRITLSIGFGGEAIGAIAEIMELIESLVENEPAHFINISTGPGCLGSQEVDRYVFSASILSEWIVSLMIRHLQSATGLSIERETSR